ncbi:unnamed protein product [Cyprideis torosa]|uniref:Polycomb protein VEFS-Box domain-containing protein n=1 Tax=Cyprideis torosa TaxID=163714 RepID=A0A7R8W8L0_9CRUS|nr:unnamed protein product [Cyprideis torosa]CAG0888690.1 unnamed protein product [Cyprideis torosa]
MGGMPTTGTGNEGGKGGGGKKDVKSGTPSDGAESLQASRAPSLSDRELFVQAYNKPTQIYRYLHARSSVNKLYLNRTLWYLTNPAGGSIWRRRRRRKFRRPSVPPLPASAEGHLHNGKGHLHNGSEEDYQEKVIRRQKQKRLEEMIQDIAKEAAKKASDAVPNVASHYLQLTILGLRHPEQNEVLRSTAKGVVERHGTLESELAVFDRTGTCTLRPGDYFIPLTPPLNARDLKSPSRKFALWEPLPRDQAENISRKMADSLFSTPVLKLRISWSAEPPTRKEVEWPTALQVRDEENEKENKRPNDLAKAAASLSERDDQHVLYQFYYRSKRLSQSELRHDFRCPWCCLDTGQIYSLLQHLNCCHPRFTFTYVTEREGAPNTFRIDVNVDTRYEDNYHGNPLDVALSPAAAQVSYGRGPPRRRASSTMVTVCRQKRHPPSLAEFVDSSKTTDLHSSRFVSGHNRVYHHTETNAVIQPHEMEEDSEGENDPEWLRVKTKMMIDEFSDVNEGEKELFKKWNLLVLKRNYVGDCQIPLALIHFIEMEGKAVVREKLYRNFVLHLASLRDFGILSSSQVLNLCRVLRARFPVPVSTPPAARTPSSGPLTEGPCTQPPPASMLAPPNGLKNGLALSEQEPSTSSTSSVTATPDDSNSSPPTPGPSDSRPSTPPHVAQQPKTVAEKVKMVWCTWNLATFSLKKHRNS